MSQLDWGPRHLSLWVNFSAKSGSEAEMQRHGPSSHILGSKSEIGHQRIQETCTEPLPRPAKSLDCLETH